MLTLEVFADVACPFTHAALARFHAFREERGLDAPVLRVRAWPLEVVNATALDGASLVPKIDALRVDVAPDRFGGFDPETFPATSLPAMISEAAAYRVGNTAGERFSLSVRRALFDDGEDVSDPDVLRRLRHECAVGEPITADETAVQADLAEGRARGVDGSPHFFTPDGDFFCPSLRIEHDASGYDVSFDEAGFEQFVSAVFA
jgi:predicted DsbA family dithiol-disulfide isomerase